MSVLVEALSLIVPRKVLDVSYPGGTDAFMNRMCEVEVPCRLVCADDRLVSVSFHGVTEAQVVGNELLGLGIVAVDGDRFQELAFVDQLQGPTMPCDWLEWRRHQDGFTYCWVAGTDPEPMHAPENWTPQHSRDITFHDIRDEPGRCFKLAEEDGRETWVDFQTGALVEGPARTIGPSSPPPKQSQSMAEDLFADSSTSDEQPLMSVVCAMLDEYEYSYQKLDDTRLHLTSRNEHGVYSLLFNANDETDLVRLSGGYGSNVPVHRRLAVAEALTRINYRLGIGNFDLDFSDGELRFRIAVDVEDGRLSIKMADNMLGFTLHTMERFHDSIMRVAFGNADPEGTIAEVP